MASSRGNTMVDVASVQQFVAGLQQAADTKKKDALKSVGAGVLTAVAISAYTNRRRA